MSPREATFYSDGIRLSALLAVPDGHAIGERRPGMVICSGRMGLKEWIPLRLAQAFLAGGHVCLVFDYRCFGQSDGPRGRLLPEEQVRDVLHATLFLAQQAEVDPARLGLVGWGLGGGLAVAAAAREPRIRAVAMLNGMGDGGRVTRDCVPYEAWLKRRDEIAADRLQRVLSGVSARVHYTDVTHPGQGGGGAHYQRFRSQLGQVTGGSGAPAPAAGLGNGLPDHFTLESAEAYYAFRPELEAHRISPRPLLIVHGVDNDYHPVDEAHSVYRHAGEPKRLVLLEQAGHLDWIDPADRRHRPILDRVAAWFDDQLAARAAESWC